LSNVCLGLFFPSGCWPRCATFIQFIVLPDDGRMQTKPVVISGSKIIVVTVIQVCAFVRLNDNNRTEMLGIENVQNYLNDDLKLRMHNYRKHRLCNS
jgi:hypothetical protein